MEKKAPLRRELLARRDALPGREERSRSRGRCWPCRSTGGPGGCCFT